MAFLRLSGTLRGARGRPGELHEPLPYFTAMWANEGVVPNWSNSYFVTFVLVMRVTLAQRYGIHGTTFVISFLSRFSQQVRRDCPTGTASQEAMAGSML